MGILSLKVNESRGLYSMALTNRSIRTGVFGVGGPNVYSAGWGCTVGVYWTIGGFLGVRFETVSGNTSPMFKTSSLEAYTYLLHYKVCFELFANE